MAALAERRIIPHDELKARAEEKAEAATRPEHLRLLEALLFAASVPLDEKTLAARLPEDVDLKASLRALQAEYVARGVNLVRVGSKWTFRTAAELRKLYEQDNTLRKDAETIAYCRIGERSAHTWFVLHELLGVPNVRNYDGSWTEWGSLVGVPVEKGA